MLNWTELHDLTNQNCRFRHCMAHILFKRQLKLYKKFEKLSSLFYCNLAQNSKKKPLLNLITFNSVTSFSTLIDCSSIRWIFLSLLRIERKEIATNDCYVFCDSMFERIKRIIRWLDNYSEWTIFLHQSEDFSEMNEIYQVSKKLLLISLYLRTTQNRILNQYFHYSPIISVSSNLLFNSIFKFLKVTLFEGNSAKLTQSYLLVSYYQFN